MAGRARPNPQNHDAQSDGAEQLKRPGWTVPFEMLGDRILTRDTPGWGCLDLPINRFVFQAFKGISLGDC